MKNSPKGLIVITLIATFLLTSCGKTYNCTCKFVDSAGKTTEVIVGAMNTTKRKAEKQCTAANYPFSSSSTVVSCHL